MKRVVFAAVFMAWSLTLANAQESDPRSADESAIREAVAGYVEAFNRHDAQGLAAFWSPEAVYTNPTTDEQVVGREAIEQQFKAIFEGSPDIQLEAATDSVQFISPNVAVERGTATLMRYDELAEISEYSAVHVKREGQWLLDRVTEEQAPAVTSHYDQLKNLKWMIGTWVEGDSQNHVETTCQWTKNRNFITRSFTLVVRDRIELAGMQIIGWDPAAQKIRSWVFDSDGGFGEGVWTHKGNQWHIQLTGVAPDGSPSSSVNILTYLDNNTFTWQSINRQAGGELLPNIDEVVVVRQNMVESVPEISSADGMLPDVNQRTR